MRKKMSNEKQEPDLVETLEAVFGKENVFVIDEDTPLPTDKWGDNEPNIDQLNDHDIMNMKQVLDHGDWWTAHFLRLYAKSDLAHRARLKEAFPNIATRFEAWEAGVSVTVLQSFDQIKG
jgi:hypothetical protein